MRLQPGDPAPAFTVLDFNGQTRQLSDYRGQKRLLAFFRYASCPLCNLRVNALIEEYPKLQARGLQILAVFQSPPERMDVSVGRQALPFALVADPAQHLYWRYGVGVSWVGLAMGGRRLGALISAGTKGFLPGPMDGAKHRIPADFLIGPNHTVELAYYGSDVGDHLPLKTIHRWLAKLGPEASGRRP
jgi:peroxiredoxin